MKRILRFFFVKKRKKLQPYGVVYNLEELFHEVNREYFSPPIHVRLSWGRRGRGQRSRVLGSYLFEENLVTVHPSLDDPEVPRYFVKFIVYHEMLHAVCPIEKVGKRRKIHTREFRRREKLFVDYTAAKKWQKEQIFYKKSKTF